jgi:hypothetical protein
MTGLSKSFPDCPYHCSNGELFDRKAHKLYPCPYCEEQRKKLVKGDVVSNLKQSFPDCPYHCYNGELMDRKAHKMYPCPYCEEQRKKIAKGATTDVEVFDKKTGRRTTLQKTFAELIGIEGRNISHKFIWEAVIHETERKYITPDSLKFLEENLTEVYNHIVMGKRPKKSYVFGLGYKGDPELIMHPMLARAYMEGLTICKPLTTLDLLYRSIEYDSFREELTADICFVLLLPNGVKAQVSEAKALMEARSVKGLPTIFITTGSPRLFTMLYDRYPSSRQNLATAAFAKYDADLQAETKYDKLAFPPDSHKPKGEIVIPNTVMRAKTATF